MHTRYSRAMRTAHINLALTRGRNTERTHGVRMWDMAETSERTIWKRASTKSERAAVRALLSQERMPGRPRRSPLDGKLQPPRIVTAIVVLRKQGTRERFSHLIYQPQRLKEVA